MGSRAFQAAKVNEGQAKPQTSSRSSASSVSASSASHGMTPDQMLGLQSQAGNMETMAMTQSSAGLPSFSQIENKFGPSMDQVQTNNNSDKPAGLQAQAYAQGTDIHIGPGQEKHLPHESWHTVQQREGSVKPTIQL